MMSTSVKLLGMCTRCLRMPLKHRKSLCASSLAVKDQKRHNTIIMERVFPIPPGKDGGLPSDKQVNELHKILRHVEIQHYPSEMKCILTDFVEGIGIRGDIVTVSRGVFHEELYPACLAVYASPANIEEFEEERKALGIEKSESRLGVFARMTMKELNHMHLDIPMNSERDWTLNKEHVKVAFRLQGVELEEDCIVLPEEPVTSYQDVVIEVWINSLESIGVKATIVPSSAKFPPAK